MMYAITNIPVSFRTPEIRNFFSDLIEKRAFKCFHFRHRPEKHFRTFISEVNKFKTLKDKTTNEPDEKQLEIDKEKKGESLISISKPKTNWLSSGLGGLSSLITQSKAKAYVETQNKLLMLSNYKDTSKETPENHNSNNSSEETNGEKDRVSTTCCVVEVNSGFEAKFIDLYNNKHWVDKNGDLHPTRCAILKIMIVDHPDHDVCNKDSSELYISSSKIVTMIEFLPPCSMPEGNVGTPTSYFQEQIKTCKLPASFVSKLGLEFPRSKGNKRFGQIPFDYGTEVFAGKKRNDENHVVFTAKGDLIPSSVNFERISKKQVKKSVIKKKRPQIDLEEEAEEGAELEEWERYESYHNDVTSQGRCKERVFEEEIEQVWEKGGSGLNFYTDAQFWREQDGDFDEKTADEWDVDMSGYYEQGAGDFDARTSLSMLESNQLRSGRHISVFKKPQLTEDRPKKKKRKQGAGDFDARTSLSMVESNQLRSGSHVIYPQLTDDRTKKKKRKQGPTMPPAIGAFESYSLGFGRRLMESQGWTDGRGLGRTGEGMPHALGNNGQHPQDKNGFGYHGEKWSGFERRVREPQPSNYDSDDDDMIITTAFDNKSQVSIHANVHSSNHSGFTGSESKEKYHRPSKLVSNPPCSKTENTIHLPFSGWGTQQKSEIAKRREENERATRLIVNPDYDQEHSNWTHKLVDPQLYKKHWSDKLVNGAQRIKISTVFDDPKTEDTPTHHLRTSEPTKLSHRPNIIFVKSSGEEI